jgi:hypothetical protein
LTRPVLTNVKISIPSLGIKDVEATIEFDQIKTSNKHELLIIGESGEPLMGFWSIAPDATGYIRVINAPKDDYAAVALDAINTGVNAYKPLSFFFYSYGGDWRWTPNIGFRTQATDDESSEYVFVTPPRIGAGPPIINSSVGSIDAPTLKAKGHPVEEVAALSLLATAFAQQHDEAKAMLMKAVAAVIADQASALDMFNKGEGGFLDRDLYVFCSTVADGKNVAIGNPNAKQFLGVDARTLKDSTGKAFGQEMYDAMQKPEGEITEVTYKFPRPGADKTPVSKVSLVTKVGDLGCGVGYYK